MAEYESTGTWWLKDEASEPEWAKYRGYGFQPVYFGETLIGGGPQKPDAWECRRGCGCVVWDPENHMRNVCSTWAPQVGSEPHG